ncbi:MAG: TonB family protein, partial [Pseudomonadota bacterium]|nr:TonB family protein [Pseudomonadota bacterium]
MHTTHKILLIAGLTLSLFSMLTHANFELGMTHYESKNFEKAYKEFFEAAEYGDHDSQQNIGAMYYRGEHVTKDIPTAYAWMALAAQSPIINQDGIHLKVFNKLNENDKKIAQEKHSELLKRYGNEAIRLKLTPIFIGKSAGLQDRRAIKRVVPEYPSDMLRMGKSGFVDVVFTVDKYGFTRDHIVHYAPSKSFEKKALEALRKFQYEPSKINNKPIDINGYKIRHNFHLTGQKLDEKELTKAVDELREKAQSGAA